MVAMNVKVQPMKLRCVTLTTALWMEVGVIGLSGPPVMGLVELDVRTELGNVTVLPLHTMGNNAVVFKLRSSNAN